MSGDGAASCWQGRGRQTRGGRLSATFRLLYDDGSVVGTADMPFTITDGTGVLTDASGHGQITVVDNSGNRRWT